MNKCQIAEYFDVSRPTVGDWVRRGCPVGKKGDLDPAAVAEWRARRDLEREDLHLLLPNLPRLVGELTRRRIALDARIVQVNTWPEGMEAEPGVIKAAVVSAMILERELLDLPARVITEGKASTLPEDIHRITLAALDRAKGGDGEE